MDPHESQRRNASFLIRAYTHAFCALAFACMAGIVVLTAVQVFSRYVLNASMFWPEEAARILLIMITFLLAGLSYQRGEMIALTVFTDFLGERLALAVSVLTHLIILALLSIVIWYGWQFAQMNAIQSAAALGISMFWVYLTIPVGFAIVFVHILCGLVLRLTGLLSGRVSQ